jgi:hypothetical protein
MTRSSRAPLCEDRLTAIAGHPLSATLEEKVKPTTGEAHGHESGSDGSSARLDTRWDPGTIRAGSWIRVNSSLPLRSAGLLPIAGDMEEHMPAAGCSVLCRGLWGAGGHPACR